jgi:photosystem II stability/assembly factor-like uncharacterized protein
LVKIMQESVWRQLPPVDLPGPVLALASGERGLLAAGMGGIAWLEQDADTWEPLSRGLPVASITALASVDTLLIAGGIGGIAHSRDGGKTWEVAALDESFASITAFAVSPHFARDQTILAATLNNGILRTENGGRKWLTTNFGLQSFEVNALLWNEDKTIFAGTTDGLYRSSNDGRSWRPIRETEGMSIVALAALPGGTLLAALEEGGLLCSTNSGRSWQPFGKVPAGTGSSSLWTTPQGTLLLSTAEQGLLHSTTQGEQWEMVLPDLVLSFTHDSARLYAGTMRGVKVSADHGLTWHDLPTPPLTDLRRIYRLGERLLLAGSHTGLLRAHGDGWQAVEALPFPLTHVAVSPEQALFAASLEGLQRSTDGGETWQTVITGTEGNLSLFTFDVHGNGWAGSADGTLLRRTRDGGATWEPLQAPFGVLSLAALQVIPGLLVATTYDPRLLTGQVWVSHNEGEHWVRVMEIEPLMTSITSHDDPPLLALGNLVLLLNGSPEQWRQIYINPQYDSQVRRITGDRRLLMALTTTGLYRSVDAGATWTLDENPFPLEEVQDITLGDHTLSVLLTGGRAWSCHLGNA